MFDAVVAGLLVGVCYSYFIYPALLGLVVLIKSGRRSKRERAVDASDVALPSATLIVAVHNGGKHVRRKVEEALALRARLPQLQAIFVSDCSSDETDAVLSAYGGREIEVLRLRQRGGKEAAQELALAEARGEVIIFTDIATRVEPDDYARLLSYFRDPLVGGASSTDRLISATSELPAEIPDTPAATEAACGEVAAGEKLYLRYEMAVRALESRAGGLIGMSGSLFAVRRACCDPWSTTICSDFNLALNVASASYVSVSAPDVIASYAPLTSSDAEAERRIRTITRGMAGLSQRLKALDPRRKPLLAFQLFSHKIMRWLTPWFFLTLLVLLAVTPQLSPFAATVLVGQLLLLTLHRLSLVIPAMRRLLLVRAGAFLVDSNAAMFVAGLRFLKGERMVTWEPSRR